MSNTTIVPNAGSVVIAGQKGQYIGLLPGQFPGAIADPQWFTGGRFSRYNISTPTQVITRPGRLWKVSVITAAATASTVDDVNNGTANIANRILTIPANATGSFDLEWPCASGILITPGAGVVLSCSFD